MKKIYLLLSTVLLLLSFSSCEYIFCSIESDNTGGGECTKNYVVKSFGLRYDYGNNTGYRYVDLETGMTYDTENSNVDLALTGSDNSLGFEMLNGATISSTNITGADWDNICDADLLPENRGGDPTGTNVQISKTGGPSTVLYYFKTSGGKYGLLYVQHIYDLTISDTWNVDQIQIKIQP